MKNQRVIVSRSQEGKPIFVVVGEEERVGCAAGGYPVCESERRVWCVWGQEGLELDAGGAGGEGEVFLNSGSYWCGVLSREELIDGVVK
jgi:hypothetical protein